MESVVWASARNQRPRVFETVRLCVCRLRLQDAIRGGKPGTREQCVAAARAALEEGACCVVDRYGSVRGNDPRGVVRGGEVVSRDAKCRGVQRTA